MAESGPQDVLAAYLGISRQRPEGAVLALLIELGAQFVGAEEGSLLVLDESAGELVFAMTVGPSASQEALVAQRVPVGEGITGLAAQTHEVQIGASVFDVDQPAEHAGGDGKPTPHAVLAAPMLAGETLVGVITAVSFEADKRFGSVDAKLYGRIAAVAGVVVAQHRRLAAIEALQSGRPTPEAIGEDERLDREILETIGRLVRLRPHAKAHIARLLADVEKLAGA